MGDRALSPSHGPHTCTLCFLFTRPTIPTVLLIAYLTTLFVAHSKTKVTLDMGSTKLRF